jgi:hypothetical protein
MRSGFFADGSGVSTPRIALIAGALVLAYVAGVKVLEGPGAASSQVSLATESPTDLERLARAIPAAKARAGAVGALATGQIDFTSTANASAKRMLQSACHGGERTVSMVAPAGGPPMLLSTCASAKTGGE